MRVQERWQEAQYQADCADATEDRHQADWIRDESDAALEGYIGALSSDIHYAEILLDALLAEKHRRKALAS